MLFIALGLLLLLTPLRWVNNLLGDSGSGGQPSYLTLVVPAVGIVLLAIGLLAYHKSDIQCIFYKACRDIDQTGLGMGIGQAGISFMENMNIFGSKTPTPESQIKPLSQLPQTQ